MSNSSLGEYGDINTFNYLKQLEFHGTSITTKTLSKYGIRIMPYDIKLYLS